jgi:hypothetical protein
MLAMIEEVYFVIIQYIKVTIQIAPIIRQFKEQNVSLHV